MDTRYKEEWGQFDLTEIVCDQIPDLERHAGRHHNGQTVTGIADSAGDPSSSSPRLAKRWTTFKIGYVFWFIPWHNLT